jgi:hypothetical protein
VTRPAFELGQITCHDTDAASSRPFQAAARPVRLECQWRRREHARTVPPTARLDRDREVYVLGAEALTIAATIKEYSYYGNERQTVVQRVRERAAR